MEIRSCDSSGKKIESGPVELFHVSIPHDHEFVDRLRSPNGYTNLIHKSYNIYVIASL